MKSICDLAFCRCSDLATIDIGSGLEYVGKEAFDECYNVTTVNIADFSKWCEIDFKGWYANPAINARSLYLMGEEVHQAVIREGTSRISDFAFSMCESLTSITIPGSVGSIGDDAFYGCKNLQTVEIFEGPTFVGRNAFTDCSSLKSIIIPNSVTKIGDRAFRGCTELTAALLGKGLADLGWFTFDGCKKLETLVSLNSTPPAFEKRDVNVNIDPFSGTNRCRLWVPKGSRNAYKTGYWNFFQTIREIEPGDADLNGEVNDIDLDAVVGFVMGRETPGFYRSLSDLNGDNAVNAADVVKLVDILSQ